MTYKTAGNRALGGGDGEGNLQMFRWSGWRGTPLEILTHESVEKRHP